MAVTETSQVASRALDDLYRQHGRDVYRYALAVLGNHADAEDITQTTFLNAYRALEQGVRPRKPSNWLLTIASNAIKQRFRQEKSRPRQVELDDRLAGTSPDESGPTVGEVLTALSRIPPQQRQAIVLREFEGRSYKELAEILGVTTSALETLLFRARRSLAEELEHQLTCTDAQLAISKATDGRIGRKERRRLREHLNECPECARFARMQPHHRTALRGLLLLPVPVSLSLFKGLEGSAAAATLPAVGAGAATAGAGAVAATSGVGAASATGGGILAGGVAMKAAAVVTAATVATGGVVGATEVATKKGPDSNSPAIVKRGKSATAQGRSVVSNGRALGKATAPGQARASGGPAPGQILVRAKPTTARSGNASKPKPTPNSNRAGNAKIPRGAAGVEKPKPTSVGGMKSTQVKPTKDEPTARGRAVGRGEKPVVTTTEKTRGKPDKTAPTGKNT